MFVLGSTFKSIISPYPKWVADGHTVAGGNGPSNALNQLNQPRGKLITDDRTIYISDASNDRIVEWKEGARNGRVIIDGNGKKSELII